MASTNDRFERRLRRFSEGVILNFKEKQFFYPPDLLQYKHVIGEPTPILDSSTPIGSMGSCFAREIKSYLESTGYNYIHYGEGKRSNHGSAAWERVYNTSCIRQEVQRALLGVRPEYYESEDGRVFDLCRKGTFFSSWGEARDEEEAYIKCAKRSFLDSDVFIFTLGLSEVWYDKINCVTLAEAPPSIIYDPSRYVSRLLSPQENIENIRVALEILFNYKPGMKVILTVSPVPLRATFFDRSATVSNSVSKSTLLYAAHIINQEFSNVYYFPSYEITYHLAKEPFGWDGRHVNESTVKLIMSLFTQIFDKSYNDDSYD